MPEIWRQFAVLEMDALAPEKTALWPWRFFRRLAIYLVAAGFFFLAFSSPFNLTPGLMFTFFGEGAAWYEWLGVLAGSSLAGGLAIEYLVVRRFHFGIVALAYLTCMTTTLVAWIGLVEMFTPPRSFSWEGLGGIVGLSTPFGIFGAIPCFHIALPISFLVASEATRTQEEGLG